MTPTPKWPWHNLKTFFFILCSLLLDVMFSLMTARLRTANTIAATRKKKNCLKEKVCFLSVQIFLLLSGEKKGFPSVVLLAHSSIIICMLTVVVQQYHRLKCELLLTQKSEEKYAENRNYVNVSAYCATKKKKTERKQKKIRNYIKHGKTVLNNKEVVSRVMSSLSAFAVRGICCWCDKRTVVWILLKIYKWINFQFIIIILSAQWNILNFLYFFFE